MSRIGFLGGVLGMMVVAGAQAETTFSVISMTPQEELPSSVEYPAIQVQFSEPVVALAALGEPMTESNVFSIEPKLNGVFRWRGTSLLSFDSTDKAIPQKIYTIKINPNLTSTKGTKISGNLSYSFHTEELKMTYVSAGWGESKKAAIDQGSVPPVLAKDIGVYFNAPVNADVVAAYLSVKDGTGKTYAFTAQAETERIVRLTLSDTPPEDTNITVTVAKGAMADADCYPTTKEQSRSFHTLVAFKVTDCNESARMGDSEMTNPVRLTFSSLLKQGSEADLARFVHTDLDYTVTAENLRVQGRTLVVFGLPVTYDSSYKLTLDEGFFDVYGRTLSKPYTHKVTVPPARSYISFKNSGLQTLESQFAPKIVFYHQNIKSPSQYTIEPLTNADGSKNNAKSVTVKLDPNAIEQNKRITQTVDLRPYLQKVGAEWRGAVRFTAKATYEFSFYGWGLGGRKLKKEKSEARNEQVIQVTDLAVTARYAYDKAVVLVTSIATGKPVSDARVKLFFVPSDDLWANDEYSLVLPITKNYRAVATATTNADGFAEISLPASFAQHYGGRNGRNQLYIEAKTKDDRVVYAPEENRLWRASVFSNGIETINDEQMVTQLFTDRGLYKPAETLTYRIIDRNLYKGDYSVPRGKQAEFKIELTDTSWRNRKVYFTTNGTLNENGATWGKITLPEDIKPGSYQLTYTRQANGRDTTQTTTVQVQFFERLKFEAHATIADQTYVTGDTLSAEIAASYLGGGNLDGSTYRAVWTRTKEPFTPPSDTYKDLQFSPSDGADGAYLYEEHTGELSADGTATLSYTTKDSVSGYPYRYRLEAQITDSSNQAIATSATTLVHPARFYVGVSGARNLKGFAKKGERLSFDYVCIAPDGQQPDAADLPKDKKLTVELRREEWKQSQMVQDNGLVTYDYKREIITEATQTLALSGTSEKTEISVTPKNGGAYVLRLATSDANGNAVVTERHFYVTSGDWYWHSQNDAQEIGITADKDEYEVGDVAQLMVQSALPAGTYLMTLEREGIISHRMLQLDAPTSLVSVPIEAGYVPVVYVSLSSYSVRSAQPNIAAGGTDDDKPKSYFGVAELKVSTKTKRFDIGITTDKATYRAGETAKITLHATQNGTPLKNAEITLMAVDRGVLDLIDYHVDDPVEHFYARSLFPDRATGGDSRNLLIAQEADDDEIMEEEAVMTMDFAAAPQMMMKSVSANRAMVEEMAYAAEADAGAEMKIRKNFEATALFLPSLTTDADGNVTAEFTLPDSLTSYRLTAIGIKEHMFALSEDELLVSEPISVRQALPRKLRLDDSGEAGVTLTNLDDKSHDVTVTLSVFDGIEKIGEPQAEDSVQKMPGSAVVHGASTKKITVRAKSTQPLMFALDAQKQGWITVQFTVQSDVVNEQILLPLEIEKPYIFEAVTTIGEVRGNGTASETEVIVLPANAEDGRGSLYVQLDPTRLGVLREAVNYVFHYPYGCMEQRSAAVLPLVAFGDYIKIFGLNSEVKKPAAVAKKEITSWADAQNADGGFPYWPDGYFKESSRYVSMRIAEILALAKQNGVFGAGGTTGIDEAALANYLLSESDSLLKKYPDASWSLYTAAYGYYAAQSIGGAVSNSKLAKIAAADASDVETLALVALTYLNKGETAQAEKLSEKLLSFTRKTSRGIDITEKHGKHYWCFFNADCEKYALYLQLFTRLHTQSDVNQRLVYELLKMQKSGRGYWQSTAVTSRILIALNDYIKTNKLEELNFTAEVLLNGNKLLDGRFKGVASQAEEADIDFASLAAVPKGKELPLVFAKDGTGTLFYTASMKYAIPPEKQTARDEGLCIYTEITDAKTGERVTADTLVAGRAYREKITISSVIDAEYVAVRAPIPAGAEILNTAFVTTGTLAPDPTQSDDDKKIVPWWYNRNRGLSYKGAYDSEMQYFWDYFPRGSQTVEFQFRAVRKGTYHTPCATAECMYEEEIFGRTDGAVWHIE